MTGTSGPYRMAFDTSFYVDLGTSLNTSFGSGFTVSAWFNSNSSGGEVLRNIGDGGAAGFYMRTNGSRLQGFRGGIDGAIEVLGATTLSNGTWYYGTVTYDNSTLSVYVNDALDAYTPASGAISTPTTSLIIGQYNGGEAFSGSIAVVSVYNKALTPSQISQNCKAQQARFSASPICN